MLYIHKICSRISSKNISSLNSHRKNTGSCSPPSVSILESSRAIIIRVYSWKLNAKKPTWMQLIFHTMAVARHQLIKIPFRYFFPTFWCYSIAIQLHSIKSTNVRTFICVFFLNGWALTMPKPNCEPKWTFPRFQFAAHPEKILVPISQLHSNFERTYKWIDEFECICVRACVGARACACVCVYVVRLFLVFSKA